MNSKTLLLFTNSFPYGEVEQFLETEIVYLSASFKEVHIFPLLASGEKRHVPDNVKIVLVDPYAPYSPLHMLKTNAFKLLRVFFKAIRVAPLHEKWLYLRRFKFFFLQVMHRANGATILKRQLSSYAPGSVVLYTYWFNLWTSLLVMGKAFLDQSYNIFSRAHGGDFDLAQNSQGYFLFRHFELAYVSKIATVSDYGRKYFRENLPAPGAIETCRLGVTDQGTNPANTSKRFHLVTCCYMVPLKRMHLIVEILRLLKIEVTWTHFGTGELFEHIKQQAKTLPSNITSVFKGSVPNKEIISFYQANAVDLFVNVSELEGIPVSIMEAISFGIPAIGCNTCGLPEIVTQQSGWLLPLHFDVQQAAQVIEGYYRVSLEDKEKFRSSVKTFWYENYNADKNYPAFVQSCLTN